MPTMILDPELQKRLQAERAATGADRYDEVWEGTYMMARMPNDEQQQLVMQLGAIFQNVLGWPGRAAIRPGVNVSDRTDEWQANYRVPDIAVFLNNGIAENHDTFWYGGPDFVIEVMSPDDQSRDKLPFYEKIKVQELLLIDRDPWSLELLRLKDGRFQAAGRSTAGTPNLLTCTAIPFSFRLVAGEARPIIEVTNLESGQIWHA